MHKTKFILIEFEFSSRQKSISDISRFVTSLCQLEVRSSARFLFKKAFIHILGTYDTNTHETITIFHITHTFNAHISQQVDHHTSTLQ